MACFPPLPPNFGRSVPTETQSNLAAIVSCIRLLSHIATPEACRAHEGLYRNVVAASAALRNIHDILSRGARQDGLPGTALPTISQFPVPGGIQ
ncbi:MAG: hypothetical protein IJS32_02550 [Kiritimatiellae bacterium]|nr:hypothetical protein [Kiritimatiellia bacterium]